MNVSEPVYRDFQRFARKQDRPAAELIREAMEAYREQRILSRHSLREHQPVSL